MVASYQEDRPLQASVCEEQIRLIRAENLEELEKERFRDGQELRSRFFEHGDPYSLVASKDRLSIYLSNASKEETIKGKLLTEK